MPIDNTWYLVTFPPCMADKTTSVVGAASVMERLDKAKKIKINIFILSLPLWFALSRIPLRNITNIIPSLSYVYWRNQPDWMCNPFSPFWFARQETHSQITDWRCTILNSWTQYAPVCSCFFKLTIALGLFNSQMALWNCHVWSLTRVVKII